MSERTAPVESDPPFRYTAELADSIETAWQDRWEAEGTFHTPNPTGRLSEGFERVAEIEDPEEGTVWRWERAVPPGRPG